MNIRILLFLLLLLSFTNAWPQDKGVWTAFTGSDGKRGYKDVAGKVMIAPKFGGPTHANRFDKVIAVMEESKMYYLLKNGIQFGRDSVFALDATFDCESEGFIKFWDKEGNVGMFNEKGKVAIPAQYNVLSSCHNGYMLALKDADKVPDGEYFWWKGGNYCLIDRNNKVLVNNIDREADIDLYSVIVGTIPADAATRTNYKGVDGKCYSFTDNQKLFRQFLDEELLDKLTPDNLIAHSYPKLVFWDGYGDGWVWRKNAGFIKENFDLIAQRLSEIKKTGAEYFLHTDYFIALPDDLENEFNTYKDNCWAFNTAKFPIINVIITHRDSGDIQQDNFTFLKTEDGFKLVSISFYDAAFK